MRQRHVYIIGGQVQGVGFRPFIFREAQRLGLTGCVRNTPEGVRIEIQGEEEALERFAAFPERLPPLARISSLSRSAAAPVEGETDFSILLSTEGEHRGHAVLISPDVAPCARCLADMSDPRNRRYGYAFTNCTDCGPRYTITRSIPYDRPTTCMACFPLCGPCAQEYHSPASRRFHAQPNACPECGPALWLEWAGQERCAASGQRQHGAVLQRLRKYAVPTPAVAGNDAVLLLLRELRNGSIAAIKGLGGFHLACDARNDAAVRRLREAKRRPHKPFAIMAASLEAADAIADIGPEGSSARALLESPARPIVICPCREDPALLSPDTSSIGVMLPSTPLHHLLFHPEWCGGSREDAFDFLVMTSGNPHGAPLCLGNREARRRLGGIADVFLFHDRDIIVRADDSVAFPAWPGQGIAEPLMVRRARGYVPSPLVLPPRDGRSPAQSVFAAGAALKSTFCITRGGEAFMSQHIGDLDSPGCMDFYEETFSHLLAILETKPQLAVCDQHPDYASGVFAESFARRCGIPLVRLQHHAAHIYAVMAEHQAVRPVLGMALDGTGYGPDGTIWGGELLLAEPHQWRRLGRFAPFPLPGGDAAVRSPWRTAEALWQVNGIPGAAPWHRGRESLLPMLREMMARGVSSPMTSSCGRLFDAVAALGDLCFDITYEGQAAIRLEQVQDFSENGWYELPLRDAGGLLEADVHALFRQAAGDRDRPGIMARRFHRGLARGLAQWALAASAATGLKEVALAGGVFNNRTLLAEVTSELAREGITALLPASFPAGDGAIALGQAFWGDLLLCRGTADA